MEISTGVLWGLISMVSWGVADYLARSYSIQEGGGRTAFYIRLISLFPPIFVLAIQAYMGQVHSPIDWPVIWKLGPLLGAVMALAYISYYHGLAIGTVSIVATVSSAWFAVGVILAFIFLGEVLSIHQAVLVGIITIGIIMLSDMRPSVNGKPSGFIYGLAAMFFLGTATLLFKYLVEASGPMLTSIVGSLGSIIVLWLWLQRTGVTLKLPGRRRLHILIAAGLLDVGGILFFIIGLEKAPIFIVAPVAAAHPIVTMVLAWIFLKERLSIIQRFGVALTIAGVIVLSAVG